MRARDSGGDDSSAMTNDELRRETPADPWIDVAPAPRVEPPPAPHPYGPAPVPARPSRGRTAGKVVALFAGGAVAGALVVGAWTGFGTRDATSAVAGVPGAPGQAGQAGQPGQPGQQGL